MERAWNVENGFETSDGGASLTVDLILSMADSENLKIFSLSTGSGFASPLAEGGGLLGSGKERSSFMRVFRALVLSWKGWTDGKGAPLQISAHELMKCHVEVPSRTAWLNAKPMASPSLSLVNCSKRRLHSSDKSLKIKIRKMINNWN